MATRKLSLLLSLVIIAVQPVAGAGLVSSAPQNLTVTVGGSVDLVCQTTHPVDCLFNKTYWIVERELGNEDTLSDCGHLLTNTDSDKHNVSFDDSRKQYKLAIKNVTRGDSGYYECFLKIEGNIVGSLMYNLRVVESTENGISNSVTTIHVTGSFNPRPHTSAPMPYTTTPGSYTIAPRPITTTLGPHTTTPRPLTICPRSYTTIAIAVTSGLLSLLAVVLAGVSILYKTRRYRSRTPDFPRQLTEGSTTAGGGGRETWREAHDIAPEDVHPTPSEESLAAVAVCLQDSMEALGLYDVPTDRRKRSFRDTPSEPHYAIPNNIPLCLMPNPNTSHKACPKTVTVEGIYDVPKSHKPLPLRSQAGESSAETQPEVGYLSHFSAWDGL